MSKLMMVLMLAVGTAACSGLPTTPTPTPAAIGMASSDTAASPSQAHAASGKVVVDILYAYTNRIPLGSGSAPYAFIWFEWCADAAHVNATALLMSQLNPETNFYEAMGDYGPGCHFRQIGPVSPLLYNHVRVFVDAGVDGSGVGNRDVIVQPIESAGGR